MKKIISIERKHCTAGAGLYPMCTSASTQFGFRLCICDDSEPKSSWSVVRNLELKMVVICSSGYG